MFMDTVKAASAMGGGWFGGCGVCWGGGIPSGRTVCSVRVSTGQAVGGDVQWQFGAAAHGETPLQITGGRPCRDYLRRVITIRATVTPTAAIGKNSR